MTDRPEDIARDVAAIARISAVPALLKLICQNTGMGFAAVARVTDGTWTACAVQDDIQFGLLPGSQLDVNTTLCREARADMAPVIIDHASQDPTYSQHITPRLYNIESYISVPIVRANGAYFGNLCAIDPTPRIVSDPRTVTMFKVFADLIAVQLESEDRREATESALTDAHATAELREQFIAVLGHDLRNPLAAVSATAELLSRRAEPDLTRIGQRLRATSQRMSNLIDDVLDFARGRLGAGIGVYIKRVDDLDAALGDVVAELREANPEREIATRIDLGSTALRCDRPRIQQLLSNLLANALTYGAADQPVTVEASIEGEMFVLRVSNGGEPIKVENLPRVFEPYWRPHTSKPGGGLGLGLYICSQIAQAHGGRLDVTSSVEDGTAFTARLPIVAPA